MQFFMLSPKIRLIFIHFEKKLCAGLNQCVGINCAGLNMRLNELRRNQ